MVQLCFRYADKSTGAERRVWFPNPTKEGVGNKVGAVRIRLLPSLYLGRDMDVKEDSLMKNRSRVWIFLSYDDFHERPTKIFRPSEPICPDERQGG